MTASPTTTKTSTASMSSAAMMGRLSRGLHGTASNVETPRNNKERRERREKIIVLVRHGRTHMNEYLTVPGCRWGDAGFTDVFVTDPADANANANALYRDSPLSPMGRKQATELGRRVERILRGGIGDQNDNGYEDDEMLAWSLRNLELIATSPLTRALETAHLGLVRPIVRSSMGTASAAAAKATNMATETRTTDYESSDVGGWYNGNGDGGGGKSPTMTVVASESVVDSCPVPVVGLPLASERVYLVSDLGSMTCSNVAAAPLSSRFPYVDFRSELRPYHPHGDEWWFTLSDRNTDGPGNGDGDVDGNARSSKDGSTNSNDEYDIDRRPSHSSDCSSTLPPLTRTTYVEWRPNSRDQVYAHPGEPEKYFCNRMMSLYDWLDSRPERTIALVCHWGVLKWLYSPDGVEFDNCDMVAVPFDELRREGYGM